MKIIIESDEKYVVDVLGDRWVGESTPKKITLFVSNKEWIILPKDENHLEIIVKDSNENLCIF